MRAYLALCLVRVWSEWLFCTDKNANAYGTFANSAMSHKIKF